MDKNLKRSANSTPVEIENPFNHTSAAQSATKTSETHESVAVTLLLQQVPDKPQPSFQSQKLKNSADTSTGPVGGSGLHGLHGLHGLIT